MTDKTPPSAKKAELEIQKLELEIEALRTKTKAALEIQKLGYEIEEMRLPSWRRKEFIAFFGTVGAATIALLGSLLVNIYLTSKSNYDNLQRDLVQRLIVDLGSPDTLSRRTAGRLFAGVDVRFSFEPFLSAYEQSLKKEKEWTPPWAPHSTTPFFRVGAMELLALTVPDNERKTDADRGPEYVWNVGSVARTSLFKRGLNDAWPLVRHKAIQGLWNMGEDGQVEVNARYKAERIADLKKTQSKSNEYGEMVLIPAGLAIVGSDDESKEAPTREIPIEAFWIDRDLVSNEQWNRVMKNEPPHDEARHNRQYQRIRTDPLFRNSPVVGISYMQAREYCGRTGKRRLPTEVEWEVAARGSAGWTYPWGESPRPSAEVLKTQSDKWAPKEPEVRLKYENQLILAGLRAGHPSDTSTFGVNKMVTSVIQWTGTEHNPKYFDRGDACTKSCVARGAAGFEEQTQNMPERARATRRLYRGTEDSDDNLGFRCAQPAADAPIAAAAVR